MIDPATESLETLSQARNAFPGRPSLATVYRWINKGVRGVKLEAIRVGGQWRTSKEARGRFSDSLNRETSNPSKSSRSAAAAAQALDALGVAVKSEEFIRKKSQLQG